MNRTSSTRFINFGRNGAGGRQQARISRPARPHDSGCAGHEYILSAFLFGGKPSQILKQIEDGRFALYYSQPIRVEMEEVLAQKFGWPDEMIHLACAPLWSIGYLTMPRRTVQACSDPDDDRILECALEAQAQFIVTGDKHLLQMVSFEKIRILKPSEFLKSVGI